MLIDRNEGLLFGGFSLIGKALVCDTRDWGSDSPHPPMEVKYMARKEIGIKEAIIPTLDEYIKKLRPPAYLYDPRTPLEAIAAWYKQSMEEYFSMFGKRNLDSTRIKGRK